MSDKLKVNIGGTVRGGFQAQVEMSREEYDSLNGCLDGGHHEILRAHETIFELVGPDSILADVEIDEIDEFDAA